MGRHACLQYAADTRCVSISAKYKAGCSLLHCFSSADVLLSVGVPDRRGVLQHQSEYSYVFLFFSNFPLSHHRRFNISVLYSYLCDSLPLDIRTSLITGGQGTFIICTTISLIHPCAVERKTDTTKSAQKIPTVQC